MMFLKLAWRNVFRNYRRSILTIAAITIGVAALIFLWAFMSGTNEQMIENSTSYVSGHVQIHHSGYHARQSLDLMIDHPYDIESILTQQPNVASVTKRLEGMAILSVGDKSRGVMVMGVDPLREVKVTTLHKTLKVGSYFTSSDAPEILIGDKAAEILNVKPGTEVVLVTQGADGSIGAEKYRVQGIFDAKMDMLDANYVFLPLAQTQTLYAASQGVTSVVARLNKRDATGKLLAALSTKIDKQYETLDWQALLPNVVQSVEFHEIVAYILLLVLFVVVAAGVTNTMLMAVMERYREFGIMMALGTGTRYVFQLIFFEACILGLMGLLIGIVIGIGVTAYFSLHGIDFGRYTQAMETMQGLTSVVYPQLTMGNIGFIIGMIFLITVTAALYPAWKICTLRPLQAIHGSGRRSARFSRPLNLHINVSIRLPVFFKIAWRNLLRNPRRSSLTIAATAFGLAAFVFLLSFIEGYLLQLVENSTGYITGDIQLQHPRFAEDMSPQFTLPAPERLFKAVQEESDVSATAPRIQAQVLITSPLQSKNIVLFGIDPIAEQKVTFINRAVKQGRFLQTAQDKEIIIGAELAEKLGVKLNEKLVVMTQALDGSLSSNAYRVGGIFTTGSPSFDGTMAFVTLPSAQALLGVKNNISSIVIKLKDRARASLIAGRLGNKFGNSQTAVRAWQELLPEVSQMIDYIGVNTTLIIGIVFLVVAIGVMNTLLMSVMERTHELGIMLAIGTKPSEVIRLILYESVLLALIGVVLGYLIGAALVAYYGSTPIDLSRYVRGLQTIPGLTGIIYPKLVPAKLVLPVLALLALSMVAAFYPAWRAARLNPVSAIKHV